MGTDLNRTPIPKSGNGDALWSPRSTVSGLSPLSRVNCFGSTQPIVDEATGDADRRWYGGQVVDCEPGRLGYLGLLTGDLTTRIASPVGDHQ